MLLDQRMDKENVVHLHNGVLLSGKKNDILKFASKWMELETLREVIQTQKDKYVCTHSYVAFRHKAKKTSLQITIPENSDNNEDTKRDIHRFNLYGK